MDDTLKDALDAARYQSRIRKQVEGDSDQDEGEAIPVEQVSIEDDSDLEISRDQWGRMVVKRNGKVTYYEGKTDDPR